MGSKMEDSVPNKHKIDFLLGEDQPAKIHKSTSFSSVDGLSDIPTPSSSFESQNDFMDGGIVKSSSFLELSQMVGDQSSEPRTPTTPTQMLPSLFESLTLPRSPSTPRRKMSHHSPHPYAINSYRTFPPPSTSTSANNNTQNTTHDDRSLPPYVTLPRSNSYNQRPPNTTRFTLVERMMSVAQERSNNITEQEMRASSHHNIHNNHNNNYNNNNPNNNPNSDHLRHYSIPQSPLDNRELVMERMQNGHSVQNSQPFGHRHSDPEAMYAVAAANHAHFGLTEPNNTRPDYRRLQYPQPIGHLDSSGFFTPINSSQSGNATSTTPPFEFQQPAKEPVSSSDSSNSSESDAMDTSSSNQNAGFYLSPPVIATDITLQLSPYNGPFASLDEYVIYYMAQIRAQSYCTILPIADSLKKEDKKIMCPFGGGCEKKIKGKGNLRRHIEWHLRKIEEEIRKKHASLAKVPPTEEKEKAEKPKQKWTLKKKEASENSSPANHSTTTTSSGRTSPPASFASVIFNGLTGGSQNNKSEQAKK